ncbi:MAG TPA: GNAT family N-acetyltransferase [Albitalea sp.]|jgi:ribosomal-protein-alanine N-acetyltransferase|nr:GNAT family N-acetyltransferase [Albitalea sp.]
MPLQRPAAADRIATARLVLQAPDAAMSRPVLDFLLRNRAHFAPWDPPMPADFLTLRVQRLRLTRAARQFAHGEGFRYWLRLRDDAERIVGQVHFSSVSRGPFQNAMLGYQLEQALEGGGYMREALRAGIDEMFSEHVHLHRLQAAHLPENVRSAAVLARLGFEREGLARNYLFINGAWRDHVLNALVNPAFSGVPVVV